MTDNNEESDSSYEHKKEKDKWDKGTKEAAYYQEYLDESERNPLSQHGDGPLNKVVKPEEMPWEETPQGVIKHVINEKMSEGLDIPVGGTDIYIQEIPPNEKSGKHRHMSEELVYIIEGEGYDLHWDPKAVIREEYDWEWPEDPQKFEYVEDDIVYVPPNTAHQHCNTSDEPLRILCCQARVYTQLGMGMKDLEQLEPAPDFTSD